VTAQQSSPPRPVPSRPTTAVEGPETVGGVVELVKAYAMQETLGPLKGAGRWLAMGMIGAVLLGLGLSIMILGILRLIQTEWPRSASGALSWLAYLLVLLITVALAALSISRINRDRLNKESK
jgi:hypothetical protein